MTMLSPQEHQFQLQDVNGELRRTRLGPDHSYLGSELWGMHSPTVALANKSRTDLQKLGLLPLQVIWWQQTLQFYNKLATSPRDSLFQCHSA
ncbi:hypothetical protein ABBQ32_007336 [Trebouxia sp. C0010 RCD-2024]